MKLRAFERVSRRNMADVYRHSSVLSSTERAPLYSDGIVSFCLQRSLWRRRIRTHRKGRLRDGQPEMVRNCFQQAPEGDVGFSAVMEYLEMCGEWWEQSVKERKGFTDFQVGQETECFQCCQTENTAASELLSDIYSPLFFSKEEKTLFFPSWNFVLFYMRGKCVWFFFFIHLFIFLFIFCDFFFSVTFLHNIFLARKQDR